MAQLIDSNGVHEGMYGPNGLALSTGHILNDKALADIRVQTNLTTDQIRRGIEYGLVCKMIGVAWLDAAVPLLNRSDDDAEYAAYERFVGNGDGDPLLDLDDALLQIGAADIESDEELAILCRTENGIPKRGDED